MASQQDHHHHSDQPRPRHPYPRTVHLRNNTPVFTAKGVEVVPFSDGCTTNGKLMLHDSCIDKPTPDNYTCSEQKNFQKCDFPFLTSPLAAQWWVGS